jgi:hypothetical protein
LVTVELVKATTIVDLEGQQAVGQAAGIKYWTVGAANLSANGTITFSPGVGTSGTGTLTTVGYIGQPTGFQAFAQQGNALSSAGPGDTITDPAFSGLSNTGTGVGMDIFAGANSGTYSETITFGNATSFTAIASPGQTAPAGGTYTGLFENPEISFDGQVAFAAELSSAFAGVFLYSNQTVTNVALSGQTAPGVAVPFYQFNNSPNISNGGLVTFVANTGGPGNLGPTGIWTGSVGSLQLVASSISAAPGAGAGATFASFNSSVPPVNRDGQLAFRASLQLSGAVTSANDTGIWTNLSGSLQLVAREGNQAPGMPAGVKYGDFGGGQSTNDPVLNNQGIIAFPATLTGSTVSDAIFGGTPGALAPLVLAGQPVAGLPASITTLGFYDLDMNASGQIVFYASLSGSQLNQFDSNAILAYNPGNGVSLVAWGGQAIPGTSLTPNNGVEFDSGTGADHPTVLSDSGLVAFTAFASSGNAIVVTAIPEPASLTLFAAAACFMLNSRRSVRKKCPPI